MATVVAGTTPAGPAYAFSRQSAVDRNLYKSYFVTVPEGAKALQVNLTGIATGSQTRFIAIDPWGVPVDSTASTGVLHQLLRLAAATRAPGRTRTRRRGSGRSRWSPGAPRRR